MAILQATIALERLVPTSSCSSVVKLFIAFVFCAVPAITSHAQTLTTLHTFCSQQNCADGLNPGAGLIQASDGNLYGSAEQGGDYQNCVYGCGTLFKITPGGAFSTLYSFCPHWPCSDGTLPSSSLLQATDGNLYGSTLAGGVGSCDYSGDPGCGTIFKITMGGTLTTLHTFCTQQNCSDGAGPSAVIQASDGTFYGTTINGGAYGPSYGAGTVFKITPAGVFTTLYNFCPGYPNCPDGISPTSPLVLGTDGSFYGTTGFGGLNNGGTIFKISAGGALTTIYSFPYNYYPEGGLVQGTDGNFYGVTMSGGAGDGGTVFKVTPGGVFTTLHEFDIQPGDGEEPMAALIQGTDGSFYGTTSTGGNGATLFTITPTGNLTTLYTFCTQYPSCPDGNEPFGRLLQAANGTLYGTTYLGGGANGNYGTVFSFTGPSPTPFQFVPATPCRVVDTRNPSGEFGGPPIMGGTFRSFPIPEGSCNIPGTAAAYSLNVTVVPHGILGYLTIWPTGQTQPTVSTLNSVDGRTKANAAIVPAGSGGAVSVYANDTTDVIVDIDGYFATPGSGTYQFYTLPPCRLVDTRGSNGPLGGPRLQAQEPRDFPLLNSSCIPSGLNIAAYSLSFTAVPNPAGQQLGYLTVWPKDESQPTVSTLNNPTATVVANAAIVPAGTGGDIEVYAYDTTDLLIDIDGYFAAPGTGGLSLYPVAPCRVLDTRQNNGQPFMGEKTVNVVGSVCSPPSDAQGYIFNATVVPPDSMPYLTLWPDGNQQPMVSTLNAYDGFITSNMAIVPTNNGAIDAYAAGLTQLILDISGYFAPQELCGPL
jgi:uncharacterized repeat protein (TIGR03803 family)